MDQSGIENFWLIKIDINKFQIKDDEKFIFDFLLNDIEKD